MKYQNRSANYLKEWWNVVNVGGSEQALPPAAPPGVSLSA
ncbi:MAG: hypothetical protein ACLP3R_14510 [Candidatus Korobacteraceae bacterium]